MTPVSAFLVPATPLPVLVPDNPPWAAIREGYEAAGKALEASNPDVLLVYSTQWIAVVDELWQTRQRFEAVHVDETWHEYGELPYELVIDVELAQACIEATNEMGLNAKGVDYEGFPIDTGTIVANTMLNGERKTPLTIASNNMYHDRETTEQLGALALRNAEEQGKKAAVLAIGGLSNVQFRQQIDISEDHISRPEDDEMNHRLLELMQNGDVQGTRDFLPELAAEPQGDSHMKHVSWLIGATGGFEGATVHSYGPNYGAGAAVVEFSVS